MPELPDLLHVLHKLRETLIGARVAEQRLLAPVVLRCLVPGNLSLLLGRPLTDIQRRGHFLLFRFDGFDLAVNPMLAGRFKLVDPLERNEAALAFALTFVDARPLPPRVPQKQALRASKGAQMSLAVAEDVASSSAGTVQLRYVDDKKMGKAYLTASGDTRGIPGFDAGGVDVLGPQFTAERFVSLLRHRKDQVRVFLLDKKALDSIGNAYADEALFEARIHPKTWCRTLSHEEALALHAAIVKVMSDAVAEVAARDEPIDVKVRDFLKVRLKDVCPRCGAKLRKAGVRGMDAFFCPHCQPETRPGLVDWRKTGQ